MITCNTNLNMQTWKQQILVFLTAFRVLSLPFSQRRSEAATHRPTPSWLWTSFSFYYPLDSENIPILISLGSNLGGMLLLWLLSSVQLGWWGCRMNPGSGRPITVAPSPLRGKKGRTSRRRDLYSFTKYREMSSFSSRCILISFYSRFRNNAT